MSAFRMARQVVGAIGAMERGAGVDKIRYELRGKLSGAGFSSVRFGSQGEVALPGAGAGAGSSPGKGGGAADSGGGAR